MQGHADQGGTLLQEGGVGLGKRLKGAHFQHAFQFIVVKNRQHHDVARRRVAGAGAHQHVLLGHLLENNGFLFQCALPDQGFAQTEFVGQLLAPLHGVGAGKAQGFAVGVEGIEGADLGFQGGHHIGEKIVAQLFDAQITAHQGVEFGQLVFQLLLTPVLVGARFQGVAHFADGADQVAGFVTAVAADLGVPVAAGDAVRGAHGVFQGAGNGTGDAQGDQAEQRERHAAQGQADQLSAFIVFAAGVEVIAEALISLLLEGAVLVGVLLLQALHLGERFVAIDPRAGIFDQPGGGVVGDGDVGDKGGAQIVHRRAQGGVETLDIAEAFQETVGALPGLVQQPGVRLADGVVEGIADRQEFHIVGVDQFQHRKVVALHLAQMINIGFRDVVAVQEVSEEQEDPQARHGQNLQPHGQMLKPSH